MHTRGSLSVGSLYKLHDHDGFVLECIRVFSGDYSPYCARVRSMITGWTMDIYGINIYEDGSIDWDFSLHGIFTDRDDDGVLHERRW